MYVAATIGPRVEKTLTTGANMEIDPIPWLP